MKTLFLLLAGLFAVNTACSPQGGTHGSPAGAGRSQLSDGPITSGGGNGLDGRMTEMYSKDIQNLPEYRRYIVPVLRRLSQNRTDVLVAYLRWAANSKAWYFVPASLPSLPKERTALAFKSTDQLALHSDKEIFIDEPMYRAQTDREKAFLLLHEMVMGARLLMKKSPAKQCSILSGSLDTSSCKDPEILKLAAMDGEYDPKVEQVTLNGRDHESVRAMTIYLMDPKRAVDGPSIAALRSRLEFNFPWDHLLSNVDQDQLIAALDRTILAKTTFKAPPSYAVSKDRPCHLAPSLNAAHLAFSLGSGAGEKEAFADGEGVQSMVQIQRDRPLQIDARGVPDPRGGGQIVDLVEIESYNFPWSYTITAKNYNPSMRYQFYLSRGPQPMIIEYRLIPVALRTRSDYHNGVAAQETESIVLKDKVPMRCLAQ